MFAIVTGVVLWPPVCRWICLWQVPDVALPFDVEEFSGVEPPPAENAFVHYASASRMVDRVSTPWSRDGIGNVFSFGDHWDERLDQWLIDNSHVLSEFEVGTKIEHATGVSLCTSRNNAQDHSDLRNLLRLSETEAYRCERCGNFDEAWRWHRATLRLANHTEESCLLIDYLVGQAIRHCACDSIARRWATHPSLTAEQVHLARIEFKRFTGNRPKLSDIMKVKYLSDADLFLQTELYPDYLVPEWEDIPSLGPLSSAGKQLFLWSAGQPELSLRLLRQVLVNNLDQVDQPLHLRRPTTRSRYPMVISLDPGKRRRPGQLNPAQLNNVLDGSLGRRLIKIQLFFRLGEWESSGEVWSGLDVSYLMHSALLAMLEVNLAAHEFYRSHNEFPERFEQLVPGYLETLPLDPMSPTGAFLNYRRDSHDKAIVWSVGPDGIDDGGDIQDHNGNDRGYRIFLKKDAKLAPNELLPAPKEIDAE